MKKRNFSLLFVFALAAFLISAPACSPKYGCPINEEAHVKPDRKGKLPTKGGRSNLFPKNMRRN
jgi:hypothetical protein